MSCIPLEDLTGQRFGEAIIIGYSHHMYNRDRFNVICACSIGEDRIPVFTIKGIDLREGRIKSCGKCNLTDKPLKQTPTSYLELKNKLIYSDRLEKKEVGKYHYSWIIEEIPNVVHIDKICGFFLEDRIVVKSDWYNKYPSKTQINIQVAVNINIA